MRIADLKTPAQVVLLVAYLLTCHFAVTLDQPELQLLALMLLCVGLILRGLLDSRCYSWGLVLLLCGLGALMYRLGFSRYLLYLPPVILPLLLWAVFARTLGPGRTPLVTVIAQAVRGSLSQPLRDYTRAVTTLWSRFFISLSIGSALLPFIASAQVWSLFTNLLNYVFIALLFVGEFVYRQYRFREVDHQGFLAYLRSVLRVDTQQFR